MFDPTYEELQETTPEYQIKDGQARYMQLATLIQLYYSVSHGEPMPSVYDQERQEFKNPLETFNVTLEQQH